MATFVSGECPSCLVIRLFRGGQKMACGSEGAHAYNRQRRMGGAEEYVLEKGVCPPKMLKDIRMGLERMAAEPEMLPK